MSYRVVFSPESEMQLIDLYRYIEQEASSAIALRYTEGIVAFCESLSSFPMRGNQRDDVRPNLRVTHYKKRTVIAFCVESEPQAVYVVGIFYGGQDYESLLFEPSEH